MTNMATYTVDLTASEADYLSETLAANRSAALEIWGEPTPNFRTIKLNEAAVRHLETLPEDCDGHISDGNLYIDGSANPLTVLHNG
jgi:hypothetical protein